MLTFDWVNAYSKNVLAACLILLFLYGCTQTSHEHSINAAYRPSSEGASSFLNALKTAKVAVYPTIIRMVEKTSYSKPSQQQVVALLNENKVTQALTQKKTIDVGQLKATPQWDIFVNDMHAIADGLQSKKSVVDYNLVMAFVFDSSKQSIWGIHCYILDQQGNNAFSFLLNSHHQLFVDARLSVSDDSEASRALLIKKATSVGIRALMLQINAQDQEEALQLQGYSITSQKTAALDRKVGTVLIMTRLEERLVPTFMHSLHHSLVSAFTANGVEAKVKFMARDAIDVATFKTEMESFSPDAVMHIDLHPLLRIRKDGYQAVVGTDFEVKLMDKTSEEMFWQANGKVDYIQDAYFKRGNYTAHAGIRKEFAWHTTAAIVRTFTLDVNGHKSAPIYTVTEDRQLYKQSTD